MLDGEWGVGRTLTPQDQTLLTCRVHPKQATEPCRLRTLMLVHFTHVSEIPQEKWTGTCYPDEEVTPRPVQKMNSSLGATRLQMFTSPQRSFSSSNFILKSRLYLPGTPLYAWRIEKPLVKNREGRGIPPKFFCSSSSCFFPPRILLWISSTNHLSICLYIIYLLTYIPIF